MIVTSTAKRRWAGFSCAERRRSHLCKKKLNIISKKSILERQVKRDIHRVIVICNVYYFGKKKERKNKEYNNKNRT